MSASNLETLASAAEALATQIRSASALPPQAQLFVLGGALETFNRSLPAMNWWWQAMGNSLLFGPVQAAFEAGFFQQVPADGSAISAADLAAKTKLTEDRVARVMRFLAINGIFTESNENHFRHSPISQAVSNSHAGLTPAIEWAFTDMQRAGDSLLPAMKSESADAWTERFGTTMFKYIELEGNDAIRGRYGRAVAQHTINETDEIKDIVPWDKFKLVVDIGAGNGQVGAVLTKYHKHLHIINQDMENVIADRVKELSLAPTEEQDAFKEVEFEALDYYSPQTRTDAEAFLIRFVLHNNNDENCVKIIKAVVPALAANQHGENARLLIAERVMPEWDTDKVAQLKQQRVEDIAMLISCSGKQRTVAELEALLKKADPALTIDQVYSGKDVFRVLSIKYVQAQAP